MRRSPGPGSSGPRRPESRRPPPRANRARIVAAAIAALCLGAAFRSWRISEQLARLSPDPYGVGVSMLRYQAVKARVPPGRPLGYLTDLPAGDRANLAFLLAQYALAPSALVALPTRQSPEWIVGNFENPARAARLGAQHGLVLWEDLGHGVVLFQARRVP